MPAIARSLKLGVFGTSMGATSTDAITAPRTDSAEMIKVADYRASIRDLRSMQRELFTGIGIVQVIKQALTEANKTLDEASTLAAQAMSHDLTGTYRENQMKQFAGTLQQLDVLSQNTLFNDIRVFDKNGFQIKFQVGSRTSDVLSLETEPISAQFFGLDRLSLASPGEAESAFRVVHHALSNVRSRRKGMTKTMEQMESHIMDLGTTVENLRVAMHEMEASQPKLNQVSGATGQEHVGLDAEALLKVLSS